ncbi:hypothetical protein [Xanthobacter autotrophicus]|uniref:hypothetical protein n=1 Tax=Xanthobacter autotrophicus TaxID=280 RepID=UPI0024A6D6AE|nr:hypothetical protein [Xanthobacter autotrophicus]MDI4655562.1 hypothetical protein [Xanthobacter autotrophicus]
MTTEVARFQPKAQQEAIYRDGQPALVSKKAKTVAMVRPASRGIRAGARPIYVVGIYNATGAPITLRAEDITVEQLIDGQPVQPLKVYSYEDLVREEQTRQVVAAVLVGVAAGANAAAASRSGYYTNTSQVYSRYGTATVVTNGYSPTANAVAQANASYQNAQMVNSAVERGQQNLATLEREVLKDNTMMPGEWYGGQVVFDPPQTSTGDQKAYRITISVGGERHEVDVSQEAAGRA